MINTISQAAIFLLGVIAMILIARKSKWGFVCGLATQPFWYYTTYLNGQWGIFFLNIAYTGTWIYGVWEWFKPPIQHTSLDSVANGELPWV